MTAATASPTILLIGCGRMGAAFLRAWRDRFTVFVHDPAAGDVPGATWLPRLAGLQALPRPLTVFLAVKPQIVAEAAVALRPLVGPDVLFVSIAAGVTLGDLYDVLGRDAGVVRAMLNTPVAVGQGIVAAVAGEGLDTAARTQAEVLFDAAGQSQWLADEAQMDAVTALSGSGPAYFFRFAEALANAGMALGLAPDTAAILARATLSGAGALAAAGSAPLAELRQEVTSPGGTTAAALDVLNAGGLVPLVAAAATAAQRRAGELAAEARR